MKTTGKPSKRLDLQGIRGLAIIVVLGFHFYPNIFPNGYLGVDQFFVLSGFLMCMLLKRGGGGGDNMQSCSLITLFYSKRFKRILPLYLLIILLSLLSLYTIFPDTAITTNQESAKRAILFISNQPKSDQDDYFQMLSLAIDIFTHTWSLSVEVQFYLIIPILYLIGKKFTNGNEISYYLCIGLLSFQYYVISDDSVAFNSVFSRIWQFMIGILVYLLSDTLSSTSNIYKKLPVLTDEVDDFNNNKKSTIEDCLNVVVKLKHVVLFSVVSITLFPIVLPSQFVRPYVTILTGLLMLISMDDYLLSNRILTYIGDISYSLYLIHWPIYAYWKLTYDKNFIFPLLVSIALSIIVFEYFETWYLHIKQSYLVILMIILLSCNIMLINKEYINARFGLRLFDKDYMKDEAHAYNMKWNKKDHSLLSVPECKYPKGSKDICYDTGLNKTSKYRIAVVGNSWAGNHGSLIHKECAHKANTIMQGWAHACELFYPSVTRFVGSKCTKKTPEMATWVEIFQPDILFVITRFVSVGDPFPKGVKDLKNDPIYQYMKNQTLRVAKSVKHRMYILDVLPRVVPNYVAKLVPDMRRGMNHTEIDHNMVDMTSYDMARKRYDQLFKDCGKKCIRIDYVPEFYQKSTKTYRFYDDEKGYSYFNMVNHLTPLGLEKIRHIYTDICKKL